MTDKELIQALRCESGNCLSCGLADVCFSLDAQVADRLEALLAENERLKAQVPRWVSVKERLPGEGDTNINGSVLAIMKGCTVPMDWQADVIRGCPEYFDYWISPPAPPSTEEVAE